MEETRFNNLPLEKKATFIRKHGNFVEAQDYYSYQVLFYSFENHIVELLYDFSNHIMSVEFVEQKNSESYISSQLESLVDDFPTTTTTDQALGKLNPSAG
jgi:hypothetical protein